MLVDLEDQAHQLVLRQAQLQVEPEVLDLEVLDIQEDLVVNIWEALEAITWEVSEDLECQDLDSEILVELFHSEEDLAHQVQMLELVHYQVVVDLD